MKWQKYALDGNKPESEWNLACPIAPLAPTRHVFAAFACL
jgi:hypothetical protein